MKQMKVFADPPHPPPLHPVEVEKGATADVSINRSSDCRPGWHVATDIHAHINTPGDLTCAACLWTCGLWEEAETRRHLRNMQTAGGGWTHCLYRG